MDMLRANGGAMADAVDIQDEEDKGLPRRLVPAVLRAVVAQSPEALDALLDPLHPADIADLMEQIDERDRANLLARFDPLVSRGFDTL